MDDSQAQKGHNRTYSQPTAQPSQSGRSIGHYLLGKTIGEGTFGKVKLGTHLLTNENVAIKILEKNRIVDVNDVERVAREIHILKLIRHPDIIQLYEIIETPKQLYLIMEYASGGELFDYIVKNTRVKEVEACKFFQQIISGVEYIHKLRVVHRDLKPENLLLSKEMDIKIVDFGLSNTYKEGQLLKTACGSPCYAAPEMIAGKRYLGSRVDIWSCGVILYALVCGYLPFEDPNTAQLYKKIINGDFQLPKWLSSDASDLLHCILNTNPDQRYTVEQIKQHKWFCQLERSYQKGILVGMQPIPINLSVLQQLNHYNFDLNYAKKCLEANKHNHITTSGLEDQDSIIGESQDKKEKEVKKPEPVKEKIQVDKKETEEAKEASQRLFQVKPEQHVVEKPLSYKDQERKPEKVPQKQPSPIQNRSNKTPSRGNPSPKPVHQSSPSPQSRQLTRKDQPHPPEDIPQDPQILSQSEHKRFASQDYTQVMNLANKGQKISFEEKLKIQHQQKQQEKEKEQNNANQKSLNLKLKQQKTVNDEKTASLMDSLFNQRDTSAMRSVQKYKQSRAQNRPNSITSSLITNKQQVNEKSSNQSGKNNAQKIKQAGRSSVDYQGEQIDSSKEIKENNQENSQSFMHANTIDFAKRQQNNANGNIPDLKIHRGPFDIGSVSTKAVNILIQEMYKVLELYKVLYKKVSFKYRMESEASHARNKILSLKSNFADWKNQRLSIT